MGPHGTYLRRNSKAERSNFKGCFQSYNISNEHQNDLFTNCTGAKLGSIRFRGTWAIFLIHNPTANSLDFFKQFERTQHLVVMVIPRKLVRFLKENLTFFRLHLAYFIIIAIVGTWILWGIGAKHSGLEHFDFIDCLYSITSALCITGLSSVPLEDIPAGGQVVMMLMMILGGQVVTSVVPLIVKKHRYYKVARMVIESDSKQAEDDESSSRSEAALEESPSSWRSSSPGKQGSQLLRRLSGSLSLRSKDDIWMEKMASTKRAEPLKDVFQEHRATVTLTWIVISYYVIVHLVGFFIAWISILCSRHAKHTLDQKQINTGFFALFATVSAFANGGFILANENMMAFNQSIVLLLDLVVLILLGNTMFAPALRGVVWVLHRFAKGKKKEVYEFLLKHPRKCYTHLFPRTTTIWLVLAVTGFNGFECLMFYLLDWNSKALKQLGTGDKIVNGIFQSVNTRSAGMNSMNLVDLSPSMIFLYCGMMYIAAYPVFLSRQHSRHRAEEEEEESIAGSSPRGKVKDLHDTTISTQSRRLLAQDGAYLFLSAFFICVSENKQLKKDPQNYTIFSIIFEVVSAYGNVGLTLGYNCSVRLASGPCVDVPYSFSGKWGVIGKLFIIIVMFLGRHRGLPDNIDSAIVLPDKRFSKMMRRSTPTTSSAQQIQSPPRSECTDDIS